MEKSIKDYLHLYLGCEVECGDEPIGILNGVYSVKGNLSSIYWPSTNESGFYETSLTKPFLRPLSDMTEEEARELESISGGTEVYQKGSIVYHFDSHRTLWALSKSFDLFGLIESGLAIDKTKTTS